MKKPLTETTFVSTDTASSSVPSVAAEAAQSLTTSSMEYIMNTPAARILAGDTFTDAHDFFVLEKMGSRISPIEGIEPICGLKWGFQLDLVTQLLKVDGRYFTMLIYLDKTDLWVSFPDSQRFLEYTYTDALEFIEYVAGLEDYIIFMRPLPKQIEEAKWAVSTL